MKTSGRRFVVAGLLLSIGVIMFIGWWWGSISGSAGTMKAIRSYLNDWAGALTAIGTLVIAFYTASLFTATNQLRSLAQNQENTTKILQRAYLWIEIGYIRALHDEPGLIPRIIIRNAGHLPAREVAWAFGEPHFTTDHRWQPPTDLEALRGEDGITLAPGAAMTHGGPVLHVPEDLPPNTYLYVWGYARYNDGFEFGRTTQFCHRYNMRLMLKGAERTGRRVFPKMAARYSRYYNNAT